MVFIFVIFVTNRKIKFRENFCNYLNPKKLSIPKTSFAVFTAHDPNAKVYALCVCGMCLLHLKVCVFCIMRTIFLNGLIFELSQQTFTC